MNQLIKKIVVVIISYATINAIPVEAASNDNSRVFMDCILKAINSVQGKTNLYLNDGTFYNYINGYNVFLDIDPGTIAYSEYSYVNENLQHLKLTFSIPIVFRNNECKGVTVKSITYDNGQLTMDATLNDLMGSCNKDDKKMRGLLLQNLIFSNKPYALFTGDIFNDDYLNTWSYCVDTKNCPDKKRLINRIEFRHNSTDESALKIVLKEGKLINIYSYNNLYKSYLVIGKDSKIDLDYFSYNLDMDIFNGTINNFIVNSNEGTFETENCRFKLTENTGVVFSSVEFRKDNYNSVIRFSDGNFNCKIGTGSSFKMSNIGSKSELVVGEHSNIVFNSFSMDFDKNYSSLKFNTSKANINLNKGTFDFTPESNLIIINSHFEGANITGNFTTNKEPQFIAEIYNFNLNIAGGKIALNNKSNFEVDSGKAYANKLIVNSSHPKNVITGTLDDIKLFISSRSIFQIPNKGFIIQPKTGGFIAGGNRTYPITFAENNDYPTGELLYSIPYLYFFNSELHTFYLSNGVFNGRINHIGNEVFQGKDVEITGNLPVSYSYLGTSFDINLPLRFHDGSMEFSSTKDFEFSGQIDFKVQVLKNPVRFKTPCMNDNDIDIEHMRDEHLFPISMDVSVRDIIVKENIPVEFRKGVLKDFSFNIPLTFVIHLLSGCGQYNADRDDNCNDLSGACEGKVEDRGPFAFNQELFKASSGVSPCTIHIYLPENNYTPAINLSVEYVNAKDNAYKPSLTITPSVFSSDLNIAFNRDGCEREEWMIGKILGLLKILGLSSTDIDVNKTVGSMINKTVNNEISNLCKPIKINLP